MQPRDYLPSPPSCRPRRATLALFRLCPTLFGPRRPRPDPLWPPSGLTRAPLTLYRPRFASLATGRASSSQEQWLEKWVSSTVQGPLWAVPGPKPESCFEVYRSSHCPRIGLICVLFRPVDEPVEEEPEEDNEPENDEELEGCELSEE